MGAGTQGRPAPCFPAVQPWAGMGNPVGVFRWWAEMDEGALVVEVGDDEFGAVPGVADAAGVGGGVDPRAPVGKLRVES